jgi:hypothetical protein
MPTPNNNAPKIYKINLLSPEPRSQPPLERYIGILKYGYIWVYILKPLGPPFNLRRIDLVDIYLVIDLSRFIATFLLGTLPYILGNQINYSLRN